jgi:16S rRNA G966 N2-methylase RsmD
MQGTTKKTTAIARRAIPAQPVPRGVLQQIDALIRKAHDTVAINPLEGLAYAAKAQKVAKIWTQVAREAKALGPTTNRLIASRIRAERVAGEALDAIRRDPRRGAGRPSRNGKIGSSERTEFQSALKEVGIGHNTADRWQRVFRVTDEHVEWYLADQHIEREKQLSTIELLRLAAKIERDKLRATRRSQAAAAALDQVGDDDLGIEVGSFVDVAATIADDSVSMVFTDPPYHDKTLPIYRDLGTVAARVLKDGASLITYTSHHRMPEVIAMLQAAGLTFFWPLAMVHSGKPLLWFVKGKFRSRDDLRFVNDLVISKQEKDAHPWQQGTTEARYYIEALTNLGDLVFDPFCGGGTTAIAALQTSRRYLTCDIDEESVWIARQRLREVVYG